MAEERTLGLVRAQEPMTEEEPSKEELQRRLGQARDSISNTVTEIKETVANQVQAVKDTLDWREQFKRRPVTWSAAALGVGFATGYCIASYAKGDGADYEASYAGAAMATPAKAVRSHGNGSHESGPSFFQKVAHTQAFGRVRDEAGNIGDAFVQELSNTAKAVVLPALITSLRNFIGAHLPNADKTDRQNDKRGSDN